MKISAESKELYALDSKFSKWIIERDRKCMYPGCGRNDTLSCSHFQKRGRWGSRWNNMNCDCLCMEHHRMFEENKTAYRAWKVEQLGETVVSYLETLANSGMKRKEAVELYAQFFKNVFSKAS